MKIAHFHDGSSNFFCINQNEYRWLRMHDSYTWETILSNCMTPEGRRFLLDNSSGASVRLSLSNALPISVNSADIWGAGLNYLGHSADLGVNQPSGGPGSYLRPRNSVMRNGQTIHLPSQSNRVTAEAELGLVIGRQAKNVRAKEWRSVVAGFTAVLDLTAEDAIRENPRHIPWAKGFDTFCSIGPQLVTLDEFEECEVDDIQVSTIRNDEVVASAGISKMKYGIGRLVEYFSSGRTLAPGTVICTGTPGAAPISVGDEVIASVSQVGVLSHQVN